MSKNLRVFARGISKRSVGYFYQCLHALYDNVLIVALMDSNRDVLYVVPWDMPYSRSKNQIVKNRENQVLPFSSTLVLQHLTSCLLIFSLPNSDDSDVVPLRKEEIQHMLSLYTIESQFRSSLHECVEIIDNVIYILHPSLKDGKLRQKVINNLKFLQSSMDLYQMELNNYSPWFEKYSSEIMSDIKLNSKNLSLVTIVKNKNENENENENATLYIRCQKMYFDRIQEKLGKIVDTMIAIPICERLQSIYLSNEFRNEISENENENGNININENGKNRTIIEKILSWKELKSCLKDDILFIQSDTFTACERGIDTLLEVFIRLGLTYNQFPNDINILQRDILFFIDLIPKLTSTFKIKPNKNKFFSVYISLLAFQSLTAMKYDLFIQLFTTIKYKMVNKTCQRNLNKKLAMVFFEGLANRTIIIDNNAQLKNILVKTQMINDTQIIAGVFERLKMDQQFDQVNHLASVLDSVSPQRL